MGMDISKQTYSYISELNGLEKKKLTLKIDKGHKQTERRTRVTIYFDAAFDKLSSKSVSGLVIRDVGGEILASKTIIHTEVPSPFAEIGFHFIPKAKNEYAHILAQEALKKGEGHYLLGAVLSYVHREMEKRRSRQPD
ncbi:hypothetical protein Golob_007963 [Gossypium lobatum]|uniref:RNase H type-1 domain-containing protein n=1 Tax=Gossypium lobatum TaxID=34289 RepID=A0A7J8ME07_9ROSI|nr:hypothetical protein [Gossypium lobatum]